MKTTAFLIFCCGALISFDVEVMARGEKEAGWKAKTVKENIPPPRPSFPLFMLPSFSFPGLNLPYLKALSEENRMTSSERIRATKTEYMEVTRRQTVHPVCYTAYEAKAPCLPYDQTHFFDEDYESYDFEPSHQAHESFVLNELRRKIDSTPTIKITPTRVPELPEEESARRRRYLEFKVRKVQEEPPETASNIQGSEFIPGLLRFPPRPHHHQPLDTEFSTKTVLITKLEKYTDRRVTATLVALNCLPVDRTIPMCQTNPSPIRESPDRRSDADLSEELQPVRVEDETNYNITKAGDDVEPEETIVEETTADNDYS